jgi:hypothetical protein
VIEDVDALGGVDGILSTHTTLGGVIILKGTASLLGPF